MKKILCCMPLLWSVIVPVTAQETVSVAMTQPVKSFTTTALEEADASLLSHVSVVSYSAPIAEQLMVSLDTSHHLSSKEVVRPVVKPTSFILPGALMATGTYWLFNKDCKNFNILTRDAIWNKKENEGFVPDHATMFLPFVGYYGTRLAGVKGRNTVGDASLMYVMASAINNTIVFVTKNRSAVERPNQSDLLSFPSGHTAQAFVSAEFYRLEFGQRSAWYGVAGYACAVTTGILRMRHNKHWFNDVVAGAGVGILSTRASYWLYPKIKKMVQPKSKDNMMVAPIYHNGSYGLSMAYAFN